jgi:hypothetical protein
MEQINLEQSNPDHSNLSAKEQYGDADLSIFGPDLLYGDGKRRTCIGTDTTSSDIKWYGYKKQDNGGYCVPCNQIAFCEFCAETYFPANNIYPINDIPLSKTLNCDTGKFAKCEEYGIERRCMIFQDFRFNINITDPDDKSIFRPTMIPVDKYDKSKMGAGMFPVPTKSFWELSIRVDPDSIYYNSKYWIKLEEARFADGRIVLMTDQNGSSNIVIPHDSSIIINSYDNTDESSRFFFDCPSERETEEGLVASHNKKSNILYLTISIKEETKPITIAFNDDLTRGGATRSGPTRGPVWRGSSNEQTRGGSSSEQIRSGSARDRLDGSSSQSEIDSNQSNHGNDYQGGSNFSANGYITSLTSTKTQSVFKEVKKVEAIIQLINNETEEQLVYMTEQLQNQVNISNGITNPQHQKRAEVFGHKEQLEMLL